MLLISFKYSKRLQVVIPIFFRNGNMGVPIFHFVHPWIFFRSLRKQSLIVFYIPFSSASEVITEAYFENIFQSTPYLAGIFINEFLVTTRDIKLLTTSTILTMRPITYE